MATIAQKYPPAGHEAMSKVKEIYLFLVYFSHIITAMPSFKNN